MITTAEGAETPEEIHALRNIGCTQVQGFAYGKPMSYEAASALVASMESGTGHAILKPRETRVSMFRAARLIADDRSEEHTSELQSLMRISYAVFCLKKKKQKNQKNKGRKHSH